MCQHVTDPKAADRRTESTDLRSGDRSDGSGLARVMLLLSMHSQTPPVTRVLHLTLSVRSFYACGGSSAVRPCPVLNFETGQRAGVTG